MSHTFPLEESNPEQPVISVYPDAKIASVDVAQRIASLIRAKQREGGQVVLGLATGSTPIYVYEELVRLHREEGLSFRNVVSFNLDEYFPMQPDSRQSYVAFMKEHLFDHIDIDPENVHIPDGTLPKENIESYCLAYENKIATLGGIDIQLLGIGRTGHIGFNEPGATRDSKTRLVELNDLTLRDAAATFGGKEYVPTEAITMGIDTILAARKIILMAWGKGKAEIVKKTLESEITEEIPATFLKTTEHVEFVLDNGAASSLPNLQA
ncbi:glucosamine-6-phosphate deaminase [Sphingobacterium chuzhouense]|uniref:Glucosamine-6-phosphate deaminase n=1 Tax=Sphingobacterium chuzhouense TaxID=1742264 RepID=A0ABR7XX74_9SPHI|nr:glucosamine-6-phosphate deaminase [Sphingobacterium chuzhouense]MBD1423669.1 glucosamine-6-phosphate deaminase [Sphingobacterium chuzhouense]